MIDRTRALKDILWILIFAGAVAIGFRLWFGLGATTNLTDEAPWGLWKILNMVAGVALATSGFTIGFLVYILRIESLRPMLKPAILIAFLGYGSSVFALLLDIGIPYRIWHPIVMWNEHSFLFEVAWCVMLYFTITMIELSPTVLEKFRMERIAGSLHKIGYGIVIVGISLSCLHHSSLGSLFLVTPQRLHSLWYTPRLPLLFIVSAAAAGLMVAVLAKLFHSYAYDPAAVFGDRSPCCPENNAASDPQARDLPMLRKLAGIASGILAVYLVLRIADLFATGAARDLLAMTWESYFYIGEVLLLAVLPLALMVFPKTRQSPAGLAVASASAALGLIWNRLNVGIFGYYRDAESVYFPSLTEWALSLGILAAAGMAFLYICEHLPIFESGWQERYQLRMTRFPSFDPITGVWDRAMSSGLRRTTAICVLVVPIAWAAFYPPFHEEQAGAVVKPPLALDTQRAVLKLDGNGNSFMVRFPHHDHQRRLGGESSCAKCHHLSLPGDHATPCSRCHQQMTASTNIFNHTAHMNWVAHERRLTGMFPANHSCSVCHPQSAPKQTSTAESCRECHQQNMKPLHPHGAVHDLKLASGYQSAMHQTCIDCHREQREHVGRDNLAECSNCHLERRMTTVSFAIRREPGL